MYHDGNLVDRRVYDQAGRMTGSTYGNAVVTSRVYNTDSTLASINHSGAVIGDDSYAWDANKNKTSETIAGAMSGYGFGNTGYDTEGRLSAWNRSDNNLDESWNLSPSVTRTASRKTVSKGRQKLEFPGAHAPGMELSSLRDSQKRNFKTYASGYLKMLHSASPPGLSLDD